MAPVCDLSQECDYSLGTLFSDRCQPVSHVVDLDPRGVLPHEVVPIEAIVTSCSPSVGVIAGTRERETLFVRFDPWLNRVMRRYRMTSDAREDAYGDLYCYFHELLDRYDAQRGVPLMPYLYHQLGAFVYTHARSGWRRSRREIPFYSADGAENTGHLAGDPTDEWDDRLITKQVRSLLRLAVREIPERQKCVITMRYCQELSYGEIAALLQIKPSTARSLARHGLQSLREWMQKRRIAVD